jgi:hypothetical protein
VALEVVLGDLVAGSSGGGEERLNTPTVASVRRAITLIVALTVGGLGISACSTSSSTSPPQGSPAALHQLQAAVRTTEDEGTATFRMLQTTTGVTFESSPPNPTLVVTTGYVQFSGPNAQTSVQISSSPNHPGKSETSLWFGRTVYEPTSSSQMPWVRGKAQNAYPVFGAFLPRTLTEGTATVDWQGFRRDAGSRIASYLVHEPAVPSTIGATRVIVQPYFVEVWVDTSNRIVRTSATQVVSVRGRSGQTTGTYTTTLSDFGVAFNPTVPPASEVQTS